MAEISEFQYAYFNSEAAIIRIKIPTTRNSYFEPNVELVFSNPSKRLPSAMGLFSHNHIVYMVGGYHGPKVVDYGLKVVDYGLNFVDDDDNDDGVEYGYEFNDLVHMFDPTKFHQIPVENIETLENLKCAPMVLPWVIRAEDRIYLFSRRDIFGKRINEECLDVGGPLHFQYFDPNKNLFETLPPPPLPIDPEMRIALIGVQCHFFLRGYIYVFITDTVTCFQTSKFDTIKSKWEDCKSMVDRFKEGIIPFPFFHVGDMGISDEFADNTWILVALNGALPIAYHVRLSGTGDIDPISYRVLAECKASDDVDMPFSVSDWRQLADMGGGRFCVMRSSIDFFIYVFEINFTLEHIIQTSKREGHSSDIIFKMKFNHNDTIPLELSLTGFCIASAPPLPPASPDNEDQDKNDRKRKRKGKMGSSGTH